MRWTPKKETHLCPPPEKDDAFIHKAKAQTDQLRKLADDIYAMLERVDFNKRESVLNLVTAMHKLEAESMLRAGAEHMIDKIRMLGEKHFPGQ
jgi:hypothetical protein